MHVGADEIVVDWPGVSTVAVAAVATLVYVGIQLLLENVVAPVETVIS